MPVYEYPPKLNRAEKQAKAAADLMRHKKMQKNMYKNFILGAVIVGISFLAEPVIIRILLIVVGVLNFIVGYIIYMMYALSTDSKLYTRIYEDRLEHCQKKLFGRDYLHIKLYYDEIEHSEQTPQGRLTVKLGEVRRSEFILKNSEHEQNYEVKDNCICLDFQDTKGKLVLIKEMHDKIKYPYKEYNDYDDEDDDWYSKEDMEWDKLHKHGL